MVGDDARPELGPLGGVRDPCPHRLGPTVELDLDRGIRLEVVQPGGVLVGAATRRHDHERSPSRKGDVSITDRLAPLLRPVVVSTSTGMPSRARRPCHA